jgi:repressor LexA
MDLTKRQTEVLEFIRAHHDQEGYWPSVREVQANFKFRSTNAVVGHLRALETKGALVRVPGQARAFRTIRQSSASGSAVVAGPGVETVVDLPVFGSIAAGYPVTVDAGGEVDRVRVDSRTIAESAGRTPFALRVRGESMIDAGINDGDTVVVEPRPPHDGEIVIALIDGQSTLKRFVRPKEGSPYLKSENRDFPVMHPVAELVIQGVATALVRKL